MAAAARLVPHTLLLFTRRCTHVPRTAFRSFSTQLITRNQTLHVNVQKKPQRQQTKKFSSSVKRYAATQPAPKAEAYLASGAIETGKNLVDVKKVLVIGSGGLSIGQAGEFDYSGIVQLAFRSVSCASSRLLIAAYIC